MGRYLNRGYDLFAQAVSSEIYVDKSLLLEYTNKVIHTEQKAICISRPRRFGKSMTANMISAYYDRSVDSRILFDSLKISHTELYRKHMNQYNVLFINMQEFLSMSSTVTELIDNINHRILRDLLKDYADIDYYDKSNLIDVMSDIYSATKISFVIIIDEWDCIFREYNLDNEAQRQYLDFLRLWLKDKLYAGLIYMTGILPIKKYGTHSALNMFNEFSMTNPAQLAEFVGFTNEEVIALCDRYHRNYDEFKAWYDGYRFVNCSSIYSPKSVISSLLSGVLDDYWNQTESFEALKIYLDMNYDGLYDTLLELIAGGEKAIQINSFSNDMRTFANKDDVLTLLIHLGYLGYDFEKKTVFIPNKEILDAFITATTVAKWDTVIDSIQKSHDLLEATWNRNCEVVAREIGNKHFETSILQYNDENALSYTVSLAYYAARNYYSIHREFPAGKGFADLVFIPLKKYTNIPAMIIELKKDHSAEEAIQQIKEREYFSSLSEYKNNLLLVGISYNSHTKTHTCIIEQAC